MGVENNIPEGWKWIDFIEIGDHRLKRPFISGPFGSNISSKFFVESGVPVIRGNNLKLGVSNRFNDVGFAYLTKDKADELNTYAEIDDIIFTAAGTIGQVGIIEQNNLFDRYIISNKQLRARLNKNLILPKFCYYWFSSPIMQKVIKKRNTGSTIPLINLSILKTLPLPFPPLPEQKSIAKVLTAFDDKIELLQAQNKTLENMAQTIFKEWFGKYQIEDELPKGWRVGKLGDVIDLQSGFSHNTKVSGDTKVKIAKMGVVDGKNFFNRRSVINYSETIDSKYKLKEDDIIVSTRDVTRDKLIIGNVSLIPDDLANFGLYAGSNTWIIKTDLNQYYLFLLLRNRNFRHHIIQSSKGSTIVMITRDAFLNCPLIFPHENVLLEFINTIDPIFKKIKNNNSTIQSLTKTRDTLLPKLMSGQVRVNNVKQTADA
jgi:type I restriction enzyme S subunit